MILFIILIVAIIIYFLLPWNLLVLNLIKKECLDNKYSFFNLYLQKINLFDIIYPNKAYYFLADLSPYRIYVIQPKKILTQS